MVGDYSNPSSIISYLDAIVWVLGQRLELVREVPWCVVLLLLHNAKRGDQPAVSCACGMLMNFTVCLTMGHNARRPKQYHCSHPGNTVRLIANYPLYIIVTKVTSATI